MSILNSLLNDSFIDFYMKIEESIDALAKELIEDIRVEEGDVAIEEARYSIVNRIRNGKVQRRKKVSNIPGYRFQDGRLVRMSTQERLRRKMSQRRGAIKRKATQASALRRRKISMHKRGRL